MELTVRPVRAEDRARVLDISSRVWGGQDHVPLFFDEWVKDDGFLAAEASGRVVGFGKASELAPGECWLEALRVDSELTGRGIGTRLSDEILRRTLARRPRSLRLATAEVNRESRRIIEHMGFREFSRTRLYQGVPRPPAEGATLFVPAAEQAHGFIARDPELGANRGLLPWSWVFRQVTAEHVAELVAAGAVVAAGRGPDVEGLAVVRPHRYPRHGLDVSFIGGSDRARAALVRYILGRAAASGAERLSGMAAGAVMRSAFDDLGMEPHPEFAEAIVYEYPLA